MIPPFSDKTTPNRRDRDGVVVSRSLPYREVDADCLVLPVDLVGEVVEQADDGGLLQGHGAAEARAHDGRPRQRDAVPVVQVAQTHATVAAQQTVQGALWTEVKSIK